MTTKPVYHQTMEVEFYGTLFLKKDLNKDARVSLTNCLAEQMTIMKNATECMMADYDCISAEFVSLHNTGIGTINCSGEEYKTEVKVRYVANVETDAPLSERYAFGLFSRVATKTFFQELEIDKIKITLNKTTGLNQNFYTKEPDEMEL